MAKAREEANKKSRKEGGGRKKERKVAWRPVSFGTDVNVNRLQMRAGKRKRAGALPTRPFHGNLMPLLFDLTCKLD